MSSAKNGDFARLLDDLFQASATPAADVGPAATPTIAVDYLAVVDELHSGRIKVSGQEASAEYHAAGATMEEVLREIDMRRAEIVPPPLEPEPLPSISPQDIVRELKLETLKRAADLVRARRVFAFDNHPDRVPPHLRERAMTRMQIANMLIDQALRRAKR